MKYGPLIIPLILYMILISIRYINPQLSQLASYIAFYVALGQAFNIFLGLTGYVDFGYVAFMALGMYGMALTTVNIHNILVGVIDQHLRIYLLVIMGTLLGISFAVILASIVGSIALRLRGAYFAIATIGVNEGFRYLIEGSGMWRGSEGIIIAKDLIELYGYEGMTYISTEVADLMLIAIVIIGMLITYVIITSKMGYALAALRDDEDTAKIFGINTTKYKVFAFIISAALAGMLGAAKMLKDQAVFPPQAFSIMYTIEAIVVVILGGIGTVIGPLIGGVLYSLLKYYLTVIIPGIQLLLLAPILIIVILAFPSGIVGFIKKVFKSNKVKRLVI